MAKYGNKQSGYIIIIEILLQFKFISSYSDKHKKGFEKLSTLDPVFFPFLSLLGISWKRIPPP